MKPETIRNYLILLLIGLSMPATQSVAGTIVRFDTVVGSIDVRLYDTATPLSVANFLGYANSGRYEDSFIHRSVPGFVIQGGGFTHNGSGVLSIPTDPPVLNEPGISNLRGTIAYAKVGPPDGQPPNEETINSATSGWFFNLVDNSANLDNQNGGFTVFGRTLGNGMSIVDAIAALPRVNAGSPFNTLPVINFIPPTIYKENLVLLNSVIVLNLPDGDYDFDHDVDGADFMIWQTQYGSTTQAETDGNGNGIVDTADLAVWSNDFGVTAGSGGSLFGTVIPEPGTCVLAVLLACFAIFSRVRHMY
ncbi:MAG: peptidylprolyl isomerase [Pirellulales bacterium]|nr:peptidylprolyl isomerase [Pirellulales bacterium]